MPQEKDKVKGKVEHWEGKPKDEAGKLGGDTSMPIGGMVEKDRGKGREGLTDVRGGVEHREPKDLED